MGRAVTGSFSLLAEQNLASVRGRRHGRNTRLGTRLCKEAFHALWRTNTRTGLLGLLSRALFVRFDSRTIARGTDSISVWMIS